MTPRKILKLALEATEIKQRGCRQRVDQEIEVAAIGIVTMQDRAENARIRQPEAADDPADVLAILFERNGWFHVDLLQSARLADLQTEASSKHCPRWRRRFGDGSCRSILWTHPGFLDSPCRAERSAALHAAIERVVHKRHDNS